MGIGEYYVRCSGENRFEKTFIVAGGVGEREFLDLTQIALLLRLDTTLQGGQLEGLIVGSGSYFGLLGLGYAWRSTSSLFQQISSQED